MSKGSSTVLVIKDKIERILPAIDDLKAAYRVRTICADTKTMDLCKEENPDFIIFDLRKCTDKRADKAPAELCSVNSATGEKENATESAYTAALSKRRPLILQKSDDARCAAGEWIKNYCRELSIFQDICVLAMASLTEINYDETGGHILRTQYYVQLLAHHLASQGKYPELLTPENIALISKSALIHDIGKVGIPGHILLKPGKLTREEFEIMKEHTRLGREAIEYAERMLGISCKSLCFAKEIVYAHHEWWDGSGYPLGLVGEEIPLSARLMSLADVYDALISKRVYKHAYTHEMAVEMICQDAGKHFDPQIVQAFLAVEDTMRQIAQEL